MEHRLRISGFEAALVHETSFPHICEIKRAVANEGGCSQYTCRRTEWQPVPVPELLSVVSEVPSGGQAPRHGIIFPHKFKDVECNFSKRRKKSKTSVASYLT